MSSASASVSGAQPASTATSESPIALHARPKRTVRSSPNFTTTVWIAPPCTITNPMPTRKNSPYVELSDRVEASFGQQRERRFESAERDERHERHEHQPPTTRPFSGVTRDRYASLV